MRDARVIVNRLSLVSTLFLASIAACSSSVVPRGDSSGQDAVIIDEHQPVPDANPVSCAFPDGRHCAIGTSCPAGDGCNTCTCNDHAQLTCTLLDCIPASCHATADCHGAGTCIFHNPGCGMSGVCEPPRDCPTTTVFCGCDGQTHFGPCNGPDAPFFVLGDCQPPVFDAGPPPRIDCAPANVTCASIPPTCDFGMVPQVIAGCWGMCVPFDACAPIMCSPATPNACPTNSFCDASTGMCNIGRL